MCSIVLAKAAAPPPPPAAPPRQRPAPRPLMEGEPARLDTGEGLNALFLLALKKGQESQFPVAEKLMARLYQELEPEFGAEVVEALGAAWLKGTALPADKKAKAAELLQATAGHLKAGSLVDAFASGFLLMSLAQETTAEAAKLNLALLGIKGAQSAAVEAERRPMAAAAPPVAEPTKVDSQDAMKALLTLAEHNVFARHVTEATRLMTRLVTEVAVEDAQTLLTLSVEAWLKTEAFPREKLDAARAAAMTAAAAVGKRDFGAAHQAMAPIVRMITRAEPGPGFKMTLLVMGLKGAAEKTAAPPPSPGAANTPRY
jgi:hypothetical protein